MSEPSEGALNHAPLKHLPEEATRIVDAARSNGILLRLMGGLAVRVHCASLDFCERPYSDIDLVGLSSQAAKIDGLFARLGYAPNTQFNFLHGSQRLRFEDHANDRHVEVFLDLFRMDHTLDFRDRLGIHPYTISLTDLFLTKIQVVKMAEKDFHDLFSLFGGHKIGMDDREGVINAPYVARVCAHDWGLHHTVLRNLERLPEFYNYFKLEQDERRSMDTRIWILKLMIIESPKGPLWKARENIGERLPYFEHVEHVTGDE
ncbi:MAG: hypothetical protein JW880_01770 [Candidatus Thermoplasmatota archaeon]|nr:hypothetical protein [Candidatus Thermoplasmatota archaeon]